MWGHLHNNPFHNYVSNFDLFLGILYNFLISWLFLYIQSSQVLGYVKSLGRFLKFMIPGLQSPDSLFEQVWTEAREFSF